MSSVPDDTLIELLLQLQQAGPDAARVILSAQPQIAYALIALMVKMGAVDLRMLAEKLESYGVPTGPRPTVPPAVAPARAVAPALTPSSSYTNGTHTQVAVALASAPAYVNSSAPMLTTPATAPPAPSMYPNRAPSSAYPPMPQPMPPAHPHDLPSHQPGPLGRYQQGPPGAFQQGPPSAFQQGPPPIAYAPPASNQYQQQQNQYGPSGGYRAPEPDMYTSRYGGPARPPPGYQGGPAPTPSHYTPLPQQQSQADIIASFPPEQKAMIARVIEMTADEINRLPPAERSNVLQLRSTLGVPV